MPDIKEKLVELSDIQVLQREMECVKRKSATNCTDCLNCDLLMTDERILTAYTNAIEALKNAHGVTVQELDGCEYCKEDNEGFRRMFGAFSLVNPFHGKTWQIHAGKCKPREIYYCPMCGRKLSEPPKGE